MGEKERKSTSFKKFQASGRGWAGKKIWITRKPKTSKTSERKRVQVREAKVRKKENGEEAQALELSNKHWQTLAKGRY